MIESINEDIAQAAEDVEQAKDELRARWSVQAEYVVWDRQEKLEALRRMYGGAE